MSKYSKKNSLPHSSQDRLLLSFCNALAMIKSPEESLIFLRDLLSKQEMIMLAKRLEIAKYLINGFTYQDIQNMLKVSFGTVARVSIWLNTSGEGFRTILSRTKKQSLSSQEEYIKELEKPFSWHQMKKAYSLYYWPELLLEEIVKGARKRQREKLQKILDTLDEKSELFEHLRLILNKEFK